LWPAGAWAPGLLVFLRCVQGFGIGGEWGGASLVSVEHAPQGRAAFFGSIPQLGSPLGLLSSTLMVLLFGLMPGDAFLSWGWRIPFLFSATLLFVGLRVRLKLEETPAFAAAKQANALVRVPLVDTVRTAWRPLIIGVLIATPSGVGYYLINTFTITYAVHNLGLSHNVGLIGQLLTATLQAALVLVVGRWAIHRKPRIIAAFSCGLVGAWAFPLFGLMNTGVPAAIWIGQAVATLLITGLWAVLPALLSSLFPANLRYTGISVSYQGASVIGGFTPAAATILLARSNSSWPVAAMFLTVCLLSVVACLVSRNAISAKTASVP